MKNSFILIPAFLLLPFVINSQEIKFLPSDWENPAIFQKGQTDPHALHIAFDDVAGAMEERFSESKNFLSLNGIWKFKWYEKPELVNLDFSSPGFNTRNWNDIPVPSNWQMEGYGHPKFRNIALSFENDPPYIPDYYNPTACYKRSFNIPSGWKDKEVFLRFEGIKSASYIWINGEKVGYNQGGFEPAEFNISPYVKKGKNDISIEVIRFSDGSYLENQDMWRLSGIYRDVFIYALPKLHIHDFYIVTDLDENYRDAVLRLEIELENQWNTESLCQLEIDVLDNSSNSVLEEAINIKSIGIKGNSRKKIYRETLVKNPAKWSAEFPNLYTLIFQLKDVNGKHLESFSEKLGFREVEIKDEAILINGVPVKFNGVNSHMHHPRFGQAVPVETLKEDLLIMKRFNINCVRTSHYPPSPEYLDLADRIGMYIFDEVGDEAHNNIQLSYDSAWTEMYKDRSRKLVYRDRNHPSVVVWSAGNESGSGFNIDEVIKTGKEIDPGRPGWMYGGNTFLIPFEDITGPRYWEPYLLKNLADKKVLGDNDLRPSFMDEYLAATGNGLGGLDEYWELIYKYPRLTGGAIWDWISPGVETSLWIIPDNSPLKNDGAIMGRPQFVEGKYGRGLKFSGHDDWVEFYRDPGLDITGKELSISFWVKPFEINQPNTFISKGKHQYGVIMSSKDSVEFYINTNNLDETLLSPYYDNTAVRFSAKAPIDENWYGNWHQLFASYNGSELKLYIDNELRAEKKCNKNISHSPFPLCIGREAESQDQGEHSGRMSSMVIDQLRIFNKAIAPGEIEINTKNLVLSMDFENDQKEGMFYAVGLGGRTYGIIWPDRSIQPEIHQIKKSAQPVKVEEIDLEKGLFKIINRHHFMNLNEYTCSWDIQSEGKMIKKGEMEIDLPALKESELSIPYNYPEYSASKKEHILTISFHLKKSTEWENAGYEIAWDQFVFPGKSYPVEEKELSSRIEIEEDDSYISLKGEEFQYQFDKSKGNFSRFIFKGKTYFENGPVFNIWRAPLANDTDPWGSYIFNKKLKTDGLGRSTDNQLRSLGLKDPVVQVDKISAYQAGKDKVIVTIHLYSNSGNNRCSIERIEKYVIYSDGRIDMIQKIIPHNVMPDLFPRAGLQFEMDKSFREVEWYGRGPFETYPDRKTGAKIGIYKSDVDKEYVPYIIPQDYGNHTDVRWLKLEDGEGKGLFISSPDLLNFSFQKYSTDNLSRAMYTYQLREAPYNTLNIDFEVSGVGGTAIRQLEKYQVKPGVKEYRMIITPY